MKYVIITIVVFVIIFAVIFGIIYMATGDFTKNTDSFFNEIKNNNIQKSYEMTSQEFKQSTSYEVFENYINTHDAKSFQSFKWNSRSITNGEGTISGFAIKSNGEKIPLEISFIKNNGEWKINFLNIKAGISQQNILSKPNDIEISKIILKDMNDYKNALISKDSSDFYNNNIAAIWKEEATSEKINNLIFKPFLDFGDELRFDGDFKTFITTKESSINETNGVLEVEGYFGEKVQFKGEDSKLYIINKYIKENGEWKSVGLNVKIY